MVKLSQVSKLDGIRSWSLPAVTTCPGARDDSGDLVDVCKGCYATEGNYRFPNVKNVREHNREDWKRDGWVDDMVAALENERYFRAFDSGDFYHPELINKFYEVARRAHWCKFWIPTRSHKIPHLAVGIRMLETLPNVVVRRSADRINQYDPAIHGSVVVTPGAVPDGVTICTAYMRKPATCNGCRACWNKSVRTIGYVAHGQGIKHVLKHAA